MGKAARLPSGGEWGRKSLNSWSLCAIYVLGPVNTPPKSVQESVQALNKVALVIVQPL